MALSSTPTENGFAPQGGKKRELAPMTSEMVALLRQGHKWNRDEICDHFEIEPAHGQSLGHRACWHLRRMGTDAGSVLHAGETRRRYQIIETADEHDNALGAVAERGNSHFRQAGTFTPSSGSLPEDERRRALMLMQRRVIDAQKEVSIWQEELVALMEAPTLPALEEGKNGNAN